MSNFNTRGGLKDELISVMLKLRTRIINDACRIQGRPENVCWALSSYFGRDKPVGEDIKEQLQSIVDAMECPPIGRREVTSNVAMRGGLMQELNSVVSKLRICVLKDACRVRGRPENNCWADARNFARNRPVQEDIKEQLQSIVDAINCPSKGRKE